MFGIGYVVQAYLALPSERWKTWHILRAFRQQGDALLFKEMVQAQHLDVEAYVRTYDRKRIVVAIKHGAHQPILKTEPYEA